MKNSYRQIQRSSSIIGGTSVFWLLLDVIAKYILDDNRLAYDVDWLSLAVGLHVAIGAQVGMMNGLRRIGDMARISVNSTLCSSGIVYLNDGLKNEARKYFIEASKNRPFFLTCLGQVASVHLMPKHTVDPLTVLCCRGQF